MKTGLTERQQAILDFLESFIETNGFPPTLREIGKNFGISSTFGVKRHLDSLVSKGYIQVSSNSSRAILLLKKEKNVAAEEQPPSIPIIGKVAAGSPILAQENLEGSFPVDPAVFKNWGNCFALKVKGDSMINAGIFENDIIIVNQQKDAYDGEIVVALINDEATVKRLKHEKSRILLIPENNNYTPIELKKGDEFSIIGKVIGVFRVLN
ncbi:MAG TPA: transcriptional repressor LexA [Ignavibacteriales bacterium]|nr:transcriptional repressor LexA [Ignavibacteriales bacterium]